MLTFFSCKKIAKLISDSQDQTLPWQSRLVMRMHLFVCKYCSRFERQINHIQEMLQQSSIDDLQSQQELSIEAKQRIQSTIQQKMDQ